MKNTFDFIVIGGESAGPVVDSRLSEDSRVEVLLLDAGGKDQYLFYHLPAGFARMIKGTASWGWDTVPQRHMKTRFSVIPRQR